MTDTELIQGILRRDRTAFQYLVDHYQKQVVKTAYYFTGSMEDAEDLSQEIFIEIMDAARSFRHSASLSTWIYRITVNRALNLIRRNKRRQAVISLRHFLGISNGDQDNDQISPHPASCIQQPASSSFSLEDEESRLLIHRAIDSLPENQRIAFVLSQFEEMTYKEICQVMNLSLSSVESLIYRARVSLQNKLSIHFPEFNKR